MPNTINILICLTIYMVAFFAVKNINRLLTEYITVDQMEAHRSLGLFFLGGALSSLVLLLIDKTMASTSGEPMPMLTILGIQFLCGAAISLALTRIEYMSIMEKSKNAETIADEIRPIRLFSRFGICLLFVSLIGAIGGVMIAYNSLENMFGVIVVGAAFLVIALLIIAEAISNNNLSYENNLAFQKGLYDEMPEMAELFETEKQEKSKVRAKIPKKYFISTISTQTETEDEELATSNSLTEDDLNEDVIAFVESSKEDNNNN